MNFGNIRAAIIVATMLHASTSYAGETVIFAESPDWVEAVDFEGALEADEEIVLYDRQLRLDDGVVYRHTDVAYEISSPDALRRYGTLQFSWLPDKGDLTVHRIELFRDGKTIDLIAEGLRPEVLRRERELEKRSVDGQLTAVFAIPGMMVGDILRVTTSTTLTDQALNGEMQLIEGFVAEPTQLGFGRLRVTWPEKSNIGWRALGDVEAAEIRQIGGDNVLEYALPIEKPDAMPEDAPVRFRVPAQLQFGTFGDWPAVSRVMAQHFATEGTIPSDGEIAAEIERIEQDTSEPLERAALALQLVQDQISYLTNGMNGGNYLPQSPQETWENRFGDCKAKSLLLLAMLHEMGIDAEAVLVDSDAGDVVSIAQPIPGAFDHMIVRARIAGLDYWLDGTSSGASLDTIHEVPNFIWALPLVEQGAVPIRLEQRWPKVADRTFNITFDMRPGVDLPILYDYELVTRGPAGSNLRAQASETDPHKVLAFANKVVGDRIEGLVYSAKVSYDKNSGTGRLAAKGLLFDAFSIDRNSATHPVTSATTNWEFKPDRARSAWRDIPYMVGGPYTVAQNVTYLLPDGGTTAQVTGVSEVDEIAAGVRFLRKSGLEGEQYRVTDRASFVPREIPPEQISQERAAMRRIASGDPIIKITDSSRFWDQTEEEIAERIEPYIKVADQLISTFDDRPEMYRLRAVFYTYGRQWDAALADLNKALELAASVDNYLERADVYVKLGRFDDALADAEQAFELAGNPEAAALVADLLAMSGRGDEALDLLDSLGLSGDEAVDTLVLWSELSGFAGRQHEAWEKLEEMLADRPDDVALLNSKCWVAGIWSLKLDEVSPVCDEAARLSGQSAATIDSRAMVRFRLGELDAARKDLDLALSKAPGQAESRYLRGIIRLKLGDKEGREDLIKAKRISPEIEDRYKAFGIEMP